MRKLLIVLIIFVTLILGLISLFNVFSLPSKQLQVEAVELLPLDEEKALSQLSEAIRLKTIPTTNDSLKTLLSKDVQYYLKKNFPKIHQSANVKLEVLDNHLIYKWEGLNQRLNPILFIGDFLVEDPKLESLSAWKYSPFMGKIADAKIWGAGTMGSKSASIAFLQAWEQLLKDQQIPDRSLYVAIRFSADSLDAPASWKELQTSLIHSDITPEAIYSLGNYIEAEGALGLKRPIAWVGCAEQQKLELELKSSKESTLEDELQKLEQYTEIGIDENGLVYNVIHQNLLAELPFKQRWLLANKGLIGNWMKSQLKADPQLAQLLYSELKVDSLEGRKAVLRCLLHPDTDIELFKNILSNKFAAYELKWKGQSASTKNSPLSGYAFEVLQTTIKQSFDNLLVLPVVEQNDGFYRLFHQLSPNCYRFMPYIFDQIAIERSKTQVNHYLDTENYIRAIGFYHQLVRNTLI